MSVASAVFLILVVEFVALARVDWSTRGALLLLLSLQEAQMKMLSQQGEIQKSPVEWMPTLTMTPVDLLPFLPLASP